MTCIAFDGRYLAADSGTFTGELVTVGAEKIRVVKEKDKCFAFALCGTKRHLIAIDKYLKYGEKFNIKDLDADYGNSCTCGLIINKDGENCSPFAQFIYSDGTLDDQKFNLIADGAGAAFLMGVLATGASAMEAVHLSKIHTTVSSGDVRFIDCLDLFRYGNCKIETYIPQN